MPHAKAMKLQTRIPSTNFLKSKIAPKMDLNRTQNRNEASKLDPEFIHIFVVHRIHDE